MISLHFFHTNDIHSHFDHWASLVSYLNHERHRLQAEGKPCLTLDLGDHMDRVNPLTEGLLGRGNVKLLNDADYDYVTIGNNEGITFTKDILNLVYRDRHFEVILANLYDSSGKRPDWCRPYAIRVMDGVRVGFVGLTAAFAQFYTQLGWDIRDPLTELRPIVKKLREEADIVVLMSHVGLPFDERVAKELDGIDVIIGSHTHDVLQQGLLIHSTLIAQAGKFGRYAGHIVIEFDEKTRRVLHKGAELVALRGNPDPDSEREIEVLEKKGIANMQQIVASLDHAMPVSWYGDSEITRLMADALRKWCDADIGLVNAGVILEGLNPGPVTKYQIHHICPHPINPCKVNLTGREIIEMINIGLKKEFQTYQLKGFGFRGKVLGKLVFSHLTYNRVVDGENQTASDVRIDGKPVLADKKYQVGTIDMFTFGTLLPPIARASQRFFLPETLRDLLAWRLSQIE
ncbi:bifunctional metallophosphatase/5'-nucleotidase [Sporolactobacillus sp. THM7-4]|nr:bifunctional metallophosphatase/5'-nucleotidase [Sporolactobacillus sp. THM7-4]